MAEDKILVWSDDEGDVIYSFESLVVPPIGSQVEIIDRTADTLTTYEVEGQKWVVIEEKDGSTRLDSVEIDVKKVD